MMFLLVFLLLVVVGGFYAISKGLENEYDPTDPAQNAAIEPEYDEEEWESGETYADEEFEDLENSEDSPEEIDDETVEELDAMVQVDSSTDAELGL